MMITVITVINIIGSVAAIVSLVRLPYRFNVTERWGIYIFLTTAAMMYALIVSIYSLVVPVTEWKLKVVVTLWWVKTLYFTYTLKYSSIKK